MMKLECLPLMRTVLYSVLCVVPLGCAEQPPTAASRPATAAVSTQQVSQPVDAKSLLMRMADSIAQSQSFSVNIFSSYDAVQANGQKIEFSESRKILLQRPDRLRVDIEQSDGDKHVLFYDGRILTVAHPGQSVYAQAEVPGGIDTAVAYFVKDLKMRLPLAMMLVSRLPAEFERRTQTLEYVEKTSIYGVLAHHLAGSSATVDYQIWIAANDRPLPLRMVLTYKHAEGQPQYRAQFSDWNLMPQPEDSRFVFTAPKGAQKIAFVTQLPQIAPEIDSDLGQSGGQQ